MVDKYTQIYQWIPVICRVHFLSLNYNLKIKQIPILQFDPVQPDEQPHVPSVGLHVLQYMGQTPEQFIP